MRCCLRRQHHRTGHSVGDVVVPARHVIDAVLARARCAALKRAKLRDETATALAAQAAAHPQPKIVQPGIWSKNGGWISDPCGNRAQTTTQKFYEYYNSGGGSYWPGSGPREW